jgi:phosphatidylserine/phosphatidylglycerophosphate/cardiolipin synthase-like enzyme
VVRSFGRSLMLCIVSAVLAIGLLSAVPASAYAPHAGGTFNVPRSWGSSADHWRIVRHVERAINATRPTRRFPAPTILITTYLLDRAASVDALVAACRRGVSVRVILDEDIVNRNSKRLIRVLNGDNVRDANHDGRPDRRPKARACNRPLRHHRVAADDGVFTDAEAVRSASRPTDSSVTWGKDRSYVKRCQGSCRGAGGNMHSKFYAFSKTGRARHVVMVSSSNLNRGGALLGWNDLYTMRNRPKSFQVYRRIHREMTDDNRAGDGKVQVVDGPFTSRFFPMRNASRRNDPTLADLRRIGCRSALGRTRIRVSMFYWAGHRGNYLASKLLNLARNGCRVSVVYGAPSRQIASRLRAAARRHLIKLWDSRWDFNDDGFNEIRTHAKYVLVKGRYGRDRRSWQVMTGSQNWVAGSLSRGDETSLNIALRSAYADYLADWNAIRRHSRRAPYNR